MSLRVASGRTLSFAALIAVTLTLGACASGSGFVSVKTQGYELSDDELAQIRPGQSQQLVQVVLGSPAITNSFGDQVAWYYVQTKSTKTAFGLETVQSRTVLAIYFDKKGKIVDRAVYGLKDGRSIAIESRRTPSYGEDRTFIDSIIKSF